MDQSTELRYYKSSKNWYKYDPKTYLLDLITNEKVLDVGCSYGDFGKKLIQNGCTVDGIDGYQPAIDEAKKILNNVYLLDLNDNDAVRKAGDSNRYNVITFMDVLEHVSDPWNVLKTFSDKLTENGRVYFSIPNIVNIRSRINILRGKFEYEEYGVMDKTHLRFFTKKTCMDLMSQYFKDVKVIACTPIHPRLNSMVSLCPELLSLQFVLEGKSKKS